MTRTITVVAFDAKSKQHANSAVPLLRACQPTFEFEVATFPFTLPPPDIKQAHSWKVLEDQLVSAKASMDSAVVFGLSSKPIEKNWFSRAFPLHSCAIITTHDWQRISSLPELSYVVYQLTSNLIRLLHPPFANDFHQETLGCLQDFASNKKDIQLKMRTGDICFRCLASLQVSDVAEAIPAFINMLEIARLIALKRKPVSLGDDSEWFLDVWNSTKSST